jgi:biopolymer transport protein ExbB
LKESPGSKNLHHQHSNKFLTAKAYIMKLKITALTLFIACGMLLSFAGAQQPAPSPAAGAAGDTKPAVHKKSLWEQIKEGGWVMFPIGLCSVLTVYLIWDGVVRTSPDKVMPPEHVENLKAMFPPGDYVGAYNYCRDNPSPFTNICRVAISLIGEGKEAVEEGIISELGKEDSKMQTYISYLSVIGVCTPMIGLLGTVTGMIGAFAVLGSQGIGDPSALSAKIGEVLIATASGLFIAIPAFGSFYFLRNRAVKALHDVEDTIVMLFRKMPYELAAGVHIGDERLYAGTPNWLHGENPGNSSTNEALPA